MINLNLYFYHFFSGMVLTTICSLIIPPVKSSLYFYKQKVLEVNPINPESIDAQKVVQTEVIDLICENIDNTQVCEVNYYLSI